MFQQNRIHRENEIMDMFIEMVRRGIIRCPDASLDIVADHDSISISVNKEERERAISEVSSSSVNRTVIENARMR